MNANRDDDKRAVGRRIAEARRDAGLTQKELAQLVGVDETSVQAWEQGRTSPYRRIRTLEYVLGRPGSWLLHGHTQALPPGNIQFSAMRATPLSRDSEPARGERSFVAETFLRLSDRLAAVEARLDAIERQRDPDENA
jgi:transcriptional regulator with XRE-family HTH domain